MLESWPLGLRIRNFARSKSKYGDGALSGFRTSDIH